MKKRRNKKKRVLSFLMIILLVGIIGTSCYFLITNKENNNNKDNPTIKTTKKNNSKDKDYSFSTTIDELDTYYLALNGKKTMSITYNTDSNYDNKIKWTIADESIITIDDNNCIHGIKNGTTTLTGELKNGFKRTYNIMVTDLIVPPKVNHKKTALPCERYTKEEADLLDKILASRVQEGGEGSRGGVLAAARFITLEFPYLIKYFNENGRMPFKSDSGKEVSIKTPVDGEGRYYHKGLYLHESKFETLYKNPTTGKAYTKQGPAIWGCPLYDEFVGRKKANGLTCSGFVTWAMYNGGFDVGDLGAGTLGYEKELYKLGEHHEITRAYIDGKTYKVGDYIARQGHAALIIGIDDKAIYVAEELPKVSIGAGGSSGNLDLNAYVYGKYDNTTPLPGHNKKGILVDGNLKFVIEMSDIYPNGDGWYTDMWES